jgi:hypothetical protein
MSTPEDAAVFETTAAFTATGLTISDSGPRES